ncbi:hypothetical protein [Mycolicibacter senuensis]|uniref:hypothetical protein n=1 Tax=Mycolicibacter senuensis TaxID=386913 RepID=UPI000DCF4FF2|nr:hypothetical protein [Mycolicibacter senuensis]RAU99444.1 hypothetical protein DQP56_10965 [Mycolicibacter senuensis]
MTWRGWCGAAAVGMLVCAGCSLPGRSLQSAPEIAAVPVQTPLRDPVWSYRTGSLIALTDDGRLAAVDNPDQPGAATTRLSAPLDAGRNVQISRADDRTVFVPQPARNRVAAVRLAGLQQTGDIDAGPSPAYLSENSGMRVLLALSADGATVTPVEEHGLRKLPAARVAAGATGVVDGANRGRAIEFHVYGPHGISYYKGTSSPPERRGHYPTAVMAAAGDGTAASRVYLADSRGNTLYAVESARGGHGLQEIGRATVSSPIRYLGSDDNRVYAATDTAVAVFESAPFTGYPHGSIPLLRVIDYRAGLPSGPARSAPLSGMAIGPDRVYLTLRGQPVVASVAKPRL